MAGHRMKDCMPGEIFLGEFKRSESEEYGVRMMVRLTGEGSGKASDKLGVYVTEKELKGFLKQEEIELREMREALDVRMGVHAESVKVSRASVPGEQFSDEIFIGCYQSPCVAGYIFDALTSIRGGTGEEISVVDRKTGKKEKLMAYYYFADKKEFEDRLKEMELGIKEDCCKYDSRKNFYDKVKVFVGG